MKKWQQTAAVLVCAGNGTRMKGACPDKLLLELLGKPVAAWAALAYDRADYVHEIVIVTREEMIPVYEQFKEEYHLKKPLLVTAGGTTRMESVLNGVRMVPESYNFVAIGDGARPLIRPEEIDATIKAAWATGAAALGVYLTDTIKKVTAGQIVKTVPREQLVAIQTPQVFQREEYLICAAAALSLKDEFTDDTAMFERFEKKVSLVEGRRDNLKITAPEDIPVLQALLEEKKCE